MRNVAENISFAAATLAPVTAGLAYAQHGAAGAAIIGGTAATVIGSSQALRAIAAFRERRGQRERKSETFEDILNRAQRSHPPPMSHERAPSDGPAPGARHR